MSDSTAYIQQLNIDSNWTLFLDRDGVINRRLPGDYVKEMEEFEFNEGALEALRSLASKFSTIVVVTNQQGIGKGLMTHRQLEIVHHYMMEAILKEGGRIDQIYYCPDLAQDNSPNRKPNTGMAFQAQKDFPQIDFKKSIIVGDSITDMQFGEPLGMQRVFISRNEPGRLKKYEGQYDAGFSSLSAFSSCFK